MFENEKFDVYDYENIPLDIECYLVDERYMGEYENSLLQFFEGSEYKHIGYVSPVTIRNIGKHSLEVLWFPTFYRFHEVSLTIPKAVLIACVGSWECDEKPRLFVKSNWLQGLHLRQYSIFAMIDAIGVKDAIQKGELTKEKLIALRGEIDMLASDYPNISFISFADSLLLKSNWTVGYVKSNGKYTYDPEVLIYIFNKLQSIYRTHLNLEIYGIFTQGSNEYYDDPLLHISKTQNHICLNSLGVPFADLLAIDERARTSFKEKKHPASELYMDEQFYHSLNFEFTFDKTLRPKQEYHTKMQTTKKHYYYDNCQKIISNLENKKRNRLRKS